MKRGKLYKDDEEIEEHMLKDDEHWFLFDVKVAKAVLASPISRILGSVGIKLSKKLVVCDICDRPFT